MITGLKDFKNSLQSFNTVTTITHFTAIIQVNLAPLVKNWIILLVQSFTACMPLLTATSAFGLGRKCCSSQQCYLYCLHTLQSFTCRRILNMQEEEVVVNDDVFNNARCFADDFTGSFSSTVDLCTCSNTHPFNACCQPYDEEYLAKADPPIKFLSFHSYLRKLTGGVDKSVSDLL